MWNWAECPHGRRTNHRRLGYVQSKWCRYWALTASSTCIAARKLKENLAFTLRTLVYITGLTPQGRSALSPEIDSFLCIRDNSVSFSQVGVGTMSFCKGASVHNKTQRPSIWTKRRRAPKVGRPVTTGCDMSSRETGNISARRNPLAALQHTCCCCHSIFHACTGCEPHDVPPLPPCLMSKCECSFPPSSAGGYHFLFQLNSQILAAFTPLLGSFRLAHPPPYSLHLRQLFN